MRNYYACHQVEGIKQGRCSSVCPPVCLSYAPTSETVRFSDNRPTRRYCPDVPGSFPPLSMPYGHIATAVLTDDIHSNYVGFLSVFYINHSSTMHRFQLGARNRQTNGRADRWQHCLKPIGEGIIRRRWCWSSYYLQTVSHYLENTSYI